MLLSIVSTESVILLNRKHASDLPEVVRKLSERVGIAGAVEDEWGNRQDQRTDLELSRNLDEVKGRADELAAEKVGKKKDTYRSEKMCRHTIVRTFLKYINFPVLFSR